jgi:hypothetical protein
VISSWPSLLGVADADCGGALTSPLRIGAAAKSGMQRKITGFVIQSQTPTQSRMFPI